MLSEISNNPREQYGGDRGSSSSSSSSNGGAPGGRERVYIHSDEDKDDDDDDEEEEEEEDQFGPPGRGTKGRTNRAGDRRSTNASSPRSASRQVGEEDTRSHERSDLVRGGGGRSGGSVEEKLELRDVFCATRRGSPKAANDMRAAGAADSRHSSPSLASRANSNSARREPSTTEPNANEPGQDSKKRRDDERRRHRHRQRQRHQSDEDEQEPPPSLPPPPRLPNPRDGSSSGKYSVDEGHRTAAVERTASLSEKKTRGEESEPLPPPPSPLQTIGSVSPPVRRRTPSFSSSSGSGGAVSPSGEAASSGALGTREGRGGALKAEGEPAEAPAVAWAGEGRPAAARRPSWSDEDDHGGATAAGPEEKPIRTNAPATLFSLAADLDQGGLVGGGDGSDEAEDAASSSGLPATTHPDERSGALLSLSAAARAVAALTAKVERLAQASAQAPAAGRNSPASLLVLEAYRSAAAGRHDAAAWGADTTAAVAAASTVPADKAHSSSPPELESFGMVALCSAVLDLVAANATELLPPEALSGIVTAAKVRAQHRRGGKAGRVQLFDAVVGHARRLCTAAEATSEGEIGSGGAAGPAAIAAVFAACFEPVITAEADARGAERVRRKVLALLESAADPDGASTKRSQIPSAEVAALPAMVATAASGRGGGDLDGAESEKPLGKATIAASDHVGPKERRQQQQGRRGASTPSAAGASSGGVVLGGALGVGSGRKKKGSRLDLSSFGGSMAVFDTTVTAVGHGGSLNLPEFEVHTYIHTPFEPRAGRKGVRGGVYTRVVCLRGLWTSLPHFVKRHGIAVQKG